MLYRGVIVSNLGNQVTYICPEIILTQFVCPLGTNSDFVRRRELFPRVQLLNGNTHFVEDLIDINYSCVVQILNERTKLLVAHARLCGEYLAR